VLYLDSPAFHSLNTSPPQSLIEDKLHTAFSRLPQNEPISPE
jgi:hypothetical protein